MNKPSNHLLGLDEVLKSWVGSAQLNKRTSEKRKARPFFFLSEKSHRLKRYYLTSLNLISAS